MIWNKSYAHSLITSSIIILTSVDNISGSSDKLSWLKMHWTPSKREDKNHVLHDENNPGLWREERHVDSGSLPPQIQTIGCRTEPINYMTEISTASFSQSLATFQTSVLEYLRSWQGDHTTLVFKIYMKQEKKNWKRNTEPTSLWLNVTAAYLSLFNFAIQQQNHNKLWSTLHYNQRNGNSSWSQNVNIFPPFQLCCFIVSSL